MLIHHHSERMVLLLIANFHMVVYAVPLFFVLIVDLILCFFAFYQLLVEPVHEKFLL